MPRGERFLNAAFGLSVISWGVLGLIEAHSAQHVGIVRISIAALNFTVGILFFIRSPVAADASPAQILVCLPSLVVAGWALKAATPLHGWPVFAGWIFAVGGCLAITSFVFLGRSFAVLPALRDQIVTRGPFRFLRHPAYAGELIMVIACGIAAWHLGAFVPAMLAIPFVMARILAEERVLFQSPSYARYADQVKWRLLPGLW